jgi:transcriptional antiterminator RfaH
VPWQPANVHGRSSDVDSERLAGYGERFMKHWYALKTKPQREFVVCEQLRMRDIETFLPLWHSGMTDARSKLKPFFPTYLFAKIDFGTTGLTSVAHMHGMNYVVACNGEPVHVEQKVIDGIATHLGDLEKMIADTNGQLLVSGDRVKIVQGVFEGYEAIFDRYLAATDRVRLLVEFLHRPSPVSIDRSWVRKQAAENVITPGRVTN